MTTPEHDPVLAPEPNDTEVDSATANIDALPDERPATSDPDQMVDTPDELGGTGGPDPGGAG
jgi:hypothetical protein